MVPVGVSIVSVSGVKLVPFQYFPVETCRMLIRTVLTPDASLVVPHRSAAGVEHPAW